MIFLYEDELYKNFLPLVYLRPIFNLYCGRLSLYQKIRKLYHNEQLNFLVRPLLENYVQENYSNGTVNDIPKNDSISLFISARTILKQNIDVAGKEEIFINRENEIIGFRVKNSRIKQIPINIRTILNWKLPKRQVNAISAKYLWNLIELNSQELISDFSSFKNLGKISKHAFIWGDIEKLYLGRDAEIEAGSVIDLRQGPIYIDDNVKVLALSKIVGPSYIGNNSIIDQVKITGGTTIGANCRVSGEVESSIFQGCINKHHYGFIGHSYIGEWVNLGAGTTNSDLKNNYSSVKVHLGKKEIDSGQTKVGCYIGDHSKTAIGTMIPTGAVIGIFANVLESSKLIRDFYWSKGKRWQIEQALNTAKSVMLRRDKILTRAEESLIRKLYKIK